MTDVVVSHQLSPERAKALTDEVRADVARVWTKVLELYEGGAHLALGYRNWRDYWVAEFGTGGARGSSSCAPGGWSACWRPRPAAPGQ